MKLPSLDDAPEGTPNFPSMREIYGLRDALFTAQRGRCYLCWGRAGKTANFDHVIPKGMGGKNRHNVLISHPLCNTKKANRRPTQDELDFLAAINLIVYVRPQ